MIHTIQPIPYSPSSLMVFSKCERKWLLERTLRPSVLSKASMAAYIGIGVARGMELYHKDEVHSQLRPVEYYASQAVAEAQSGALQDIQDGCIIPPALEAEYALLGPRSGSAVQYLCTHQPLSPGFETIAAELVLEEWGHARIDLIVESPDGMTIVDYKTKVNTTPYMLSKTQSEYEYSHQMYFYSMALRSLGYNIESFAIAMCILEPKPRVYLWQYMIDENVLEEYEKTFRSLAERMARVKETGEANMSIEHYDQYGQCPWHAYCLLGYSQYTIPRPPRENNIS